MATSAASAVVVGLPEKRCHNVYREPHPNDPQRENVLIEAPGSLQRADFAGACRGMWQADGHALGKVLIAQGTTLSTFNPADNTTGSLTGTVAGTDRGDFAFTETQGFGLFNGQPYLSDGTYIRRASDGITIDANLAIGSTPANVATGAFSFSLDGTVYNKTAVAAGTAPGNDVIPLGLFGAVALDIDSGGNHHGDRSAGQCHGLCKRIGCGCGLACPADDAGPHRLRDGHEIRRRVHVRHDIACGIQHNGRIH